MDNRTLRVVDGPVRIRLAPSLQGQFVGWLDNGEVIRTENAPFTSDGFIWVQHERGFSAERAVDNSQVFMQEISDQPVVVVVPNEIAENQEMTLPDGTKWRPEEIFRRLPVDLNQTAWTQYFGNTRFAQGLFTDRNPSRRRIYFYSQGLHAGIDFGNPNPGVPVFAGVTGDVIGVELNSPFYSPNYVTVRVGRYNVIYGHIAGVQVTRGQRVTPDTIIASIEDVQQEHLHLEVRYLGRWIVNPFLLMSEQIRQPFFQKFSNFPAEFAPFHQWQSPLDQPVLTLSNPATAVILGPNARP